MDYEQVPPSYPHQLPPQMNMPPPMMPGSSRAFSYDEGEQQFLRDIFNFEAHVVDLLHSWNGDKINIDGDWTINTDKTKQVMNADGMTWCSSKLRAYTGNPFKMSQTNREEINGLMRPIARNINFELSKRFREFGFRDKLDIVSVFNDMVSFIFMVFKGSYENQQRNLIGSTNNYNVNEMRDTTPQKTGWFSKG